MTLLPDAITWETLTIGGGDSDIYLDGGVQGWGQPAFATPTSPRASGGEFGGLWTPQGATYTTNAWLDLDKSGARDLDAFRNLRSSMRLRPNPDDETPLAWAGLLWDGEVCAFVRPTRCEPAIDEDAVHGGAVGWDLQWLATDPTVYSYEQAAELIPTETPDNSHTFEVANAGDLVPWARRAFEFRMTAHGTVTNPRIRVDHADGSFEQIVFQDLTMTGGQVLTIGADLAPRVNGVLRGGHMRSTTEKGGPWHAPRWWRLLPSTGDDGANVVTMSVASGAFSGFCKTRDTH